ncbi:MAG TPA: hypothetical protein VLG76_07075 [Rhabdochlamydiaceae bacterium]|nr:hypothetical protein [Rhabdochlamydiaceae bacterium]
MDHLIPSLTISAHNDTFTWDNTEPRNYADISDTDWESSAERVDALSRKRKYEEAVDQSKIFLAQDSSPMTPVLENDQKVEESDHAPLESVTLPVLFEGLANTENRLGDDDLASFSSSENSSSNPTNQLLVSEAAVEGSEKVEEESKTSREQHTTIRTPRSKSRRGKFRRRSYAELNKSQRRSAAELDRIYTLAFDEFYEKGTEHEVQIAKKYDLFKNNSFGKYKNALTKCILQKETLSEEMVEKICVSKKVSYERVMDLLPKAKKHPELFYYY